MRRAGPKAVAPSCSSRYRDSGRLKKLRGMYFSSQDAIGIYRPQITQIRTDFRWKAISEKHIAAKLTRRRVIPTDDRTCCRSKFGSEENHNGASRARRDFNAVADDCRCDKLDFFSRQDSPSCGNCCFLGSLFSGGIFCALLRVRLRAVATSIGAAEGDLRAEARGVFASIAVAACDQSAYSRLATGNIG